jgi:hypothetical protein
MPKMPVMTTVRPAEHCNDRGYRRFHANSGSRDTAGVAPAAPRPRRHQRLFYEPTSGRGRPDRDRVQP